jgi:leader peptidase (prepilin peptidase)/N-methyltransferase
LPPSLVCLAAQDFALALLNQIGLNQLSLETRTAIVYLIGIFVSSQLNHAIYGWAFLRPAIGPWQKPHEKAPPRSALDYVPIIGWFGLRREDAIHGRGHWIRPLVIEILWPAALAWLYWATMKGELFPQVFILANDPILLVQFLSHAVFFSLMLIATFIDFDEQTIPDQVTVPGALLGILFAAFSPDSMLQMTNIKVALAKQHTLVHFASPQDFPNAMSGLQGLLIGLACFFVWCISVLPLLFVINWGWRRWRSAKSLAVFWGLTNRDPQSKWVFVIAIVGSISIMTAWFFRAQTEHWQAILSSLLGLFFGVALMWSVRVVCSWAMRQEAMGFGDVMLLAMIGAFLGWQATLITFLLAPIAALVIAVPQRIFTGRNDIAFGPYLCLAAAAVVVAWPYWWETQNVRDLFGQLGTTIVWIVVGCVALMGLMLRALRFWRELGGKDEEVME